MLYLVALIGVGHDLQSLCVVVHVFRAYISVSRQDITLFSKSYELRCASDLVLAIWSPHCAAVRICH